MDFLQNMMPRCMSMMFSEPDPEARRSLAEAMLQRTVNETEGQRDAAADKKMARHYVS